MTLNCLTAVAPAKIKTTNYPSAEAIYGVLKLAENALRSDGFIRLGVFYAALKRGSTGYKYGRYVEKYWAAFRGISDADLRELYEFTLLHLEKQFGPLRCRSWDNGREDEKWDWGFSEKVCRSCDTHFEGTARSWQDARVRRAAAFKDGHPDRTSSQLLGVMPNTSWRIAPNKVAKAA